MYIITGCVIGTISNAPAVDCPPPVSSAISHYRAYLKTVYKNSPISPDSKWPPTPSKEYINLAVVEGERCREDYIGHTLQGNIKQVLKNRKEISVMQILEANHDQKQPRLVLMEGAPGIGKSTLAWELCRKWEEFSCMKQYSLVVLLRLREEEVQNITDVSDLFCSYESKDKKSLVEEVLESQGKGVLFLMDGYDELPSHLQRNGYLLKLIRGSVLPESIVLVTSRPSATVKLLTICRPQRHVEVLGFTQESVEAYASSVFQSEPDTLEKFKAYISASGNPAINSLMYIPLNAAIIVQIYRDCKSESLLPHTLTELYTQLCLTILNRFLVVGVHKFEDLPSELYQQFLKLSEVAYEGMKTKQLIFHTIPTELVHFGFLDAESALYGGGGVSYNFLHLTLQEFFAAYHISSLGSDGLEVFKQCNNSEWNVVWRFVAGLTKFQHLEGYISCLQPRAIIQCLFEAQTMKYFASYFRDLPFQIKSYNDFILPLDLYMYGYCIANILTDFSFSVQFDYFDRQLNFHRFICGLKTNIPSVGYIEKLCIRSHNIRLSDIESFSFQRLTSLCLNDCGLTVTDVFHLSELIPRMICLKELDISGSIVDPDGLLKVLQSLFHSSVTTLNVTCTGFCSYQNESLLAALKQLMDLSCGKLKELLVGDAEIQWTEHCKVIDLISAHSSLQSLSLCFHTPSMLYLFVNNTCLTELFIGRYVADAYCYSDVIRKLLISNKTLKHLAILFSIHLPESCNYKFLKSIIEALQQNTTLLQLEVTISHYESETSAVKLQLEELCLEPRVATVLKVCSRKIRSNRAIPKSFTMSIKHPQTAAQI